MMELDILGIFHFNIILEISLSTVTYIFLPQKNKKNLREFWKNWEFNAIKASNSWILYGDNVIYNKIYIVGLCFWHRAPKIFGIS